MRAFFILSGLVLTAAILQGALIDPFLPAVLRLELGLTLALISFSFLRYDWALFFLFAMGLQADLLGTARFGTCTCSYLLAGGLLLGLRRDLIRGGDLAGWLAAVAGAGAYQACYQFLRCLFGAWQTFSFQEAFGALGAQVLATLVWGAFLAAGLKRLYTRAGLLCAEAEKVNARRAPRRGLLAGW